MAKIHVKVEIRMRWWLHAYLGCVTGIAVLTGLEPNWERVEYWIRRGMKVAPCKE